MAIGKFRLLDEQPHLLMKVEHGPRCDANGLAPFEDVTILG